MAFVFQGHLFIYKSFYLYWKIAWICHILGCLHRFCLLYYIVIVSVYFLYLFLDSHLWALMAEVIKAWAYSLEDTIQTQTLPSLVQSVYVVTVVWNLTSETIQLPLKHCGRYINLAWYFLLHLVFVLSLLLSQGSYEGTSTIVTEVRTHVEDWAAG